MEYKSIGQSFKDVDVKAGVVTGYLSAFGNIDSDKDMIMPGSFLKTIDEWGPNGRKRIKHFLDHDNTKSVGVFTVLKEDDYGLYYESKAGDWNLGADFLKMVEAGAITEHSIGFKTIKQEKAEGHTKIQEIKLYEGSSLQGWGANEFTPIVGVKSAEAIEKLFSTLERELKNGTYTDETMIRIESYLKSLQSEYFKTTQPNAESNITVPDESKNEVDYTEVIYQKFKQSLGQ
jgi:HK97 family phage prohead protease